MTQLQKPPKLLPSHGWSWNWATPRICHSFQTWVEVCSATSAAVAAERGDFVIVRSHFSHGDGRAGTAASTWVGKEGADQRMFQLCRTVPRHRSGAVAALHSLGSHLTAESFPGSQVTVASLFLTKEALLNKPEPDQECILCSTKGRPSKVFLLNSLVSSLLQAQLLGLLPQSCSPR